MKPDREIAQAREIVKGLQRLIEVALRHADEQSRGTRSVFHDAIAHMSEVRSKLLDVWPEARHD